MSELDSIHTQVSSSDLKRDLQAIILAAGKGTRLKELTSDTPKGLIKVNGMEIMQNCLEQLYLTHRFYRCIICVGYLKEKIMNRFGNKYKDIEIIYVENPDYDTTNNICSLLKLADYLNQNTMLFECDIFFKQEILQNIIKSTNDCNMMVSAFNPVTMNGTTLLKDENNKVVKMVLKSELDTIEDITKLYKTVNIYYFNGDFLKNILVDRLQEKASINPNSYYEEAIYELVNHTDNHFDITCDVVPEELWCEVDTQEDLEIARNHFNLNV